MARTTRSKAKKPKPKTIARRKTTTTALKRTSMWLGEDLLKASAAEAARLGISRALWVQITLRKSLGLPPVQLTLRKSQGLPAVQLVFDPDASVFA